MCVFITRTTNFSLRAHIFVESLLRAGNPYSLLSLLYFHFQKTLIQKAYKSLLLRAQSIENSNYFVIHSVY